ncbi:hypothetical protein PPYR_13794 [Photinus pyralis]|uniref:Uncharacterized protein n=1 Tax=Photinus pyralis TaxID=7054 RepID=A0A1Y1K7Z3_PHOPY|nr:estradiol 17-beta-dehydrogenase 11-like [Photinus pyralis]KAB0794174.1 hypothetical protein PPYR_13794 [Photinus pyralis]
MYSSLRTVFPILKFRNIGPRCNFGTKVSWPPSTTEENLKSLKGECVVITNCEGGLGADLAIQLAKLEAKVIVWDKNTDVLVHTKRYIKSTAGYDLEIHSCDLSNRGDVYNAAEATRNQFGEVSMVVNTVCLSSEKPFLSTHDDLLESIFRTNIMSQIWMTKAFLPHMIAANKGRFVAVSSMATHIGLPKLTDLCATNSAISNFMAALCAELEHNGITGIKMTTICPYFPQNANLHKNAKLRLLSGVSKEKIVQRTVDAILNDESHVFLPGWFKIATALRWYCPNTVSKLLKQVFIKDSNSALLLEDPPKEIVEEVLDIIEALPVNASEKESHVRIPPQLGNATQKL